MRAESIIRNGPDPNYREKSGYDGAGGFSTAPEGGPYNHGDPVTIAVGKAKEFGEGGPVLLRIEVPDEVVRPADLGPEVRFMPGYGLEELLAIWQDLPKQLIELR